MSDAERGARCINDGENDRVRYSETRFYSDPKYQAERALLRLLWSLLQNKRYPEMSKRDPLHVWWNDGGR